MTGEKPEAADGNQNAKPGSARRADGTDDSASWEAGIADEGTIPDGDAEGSTAPD